MKLQNHLRLLFLTICYFPALAFGNVEDQDGSNYGDELNETDFNAVRNFVNTKREIPLAEKASKLNITGDVHFEWRHMAETGRKGDVKGAQQILRGGNAIDYGSYPVSRNDIDAEFNLYFDYKTDRTWAVAQLQFDNSCGVFDNNKNCPKQGAKTAQGMRDIQADGRLDADPEGWHGSGRCDKLCLKKAFFGYNLYNHCDRRVDVEIGRRRLNNVFDSDIQFLSQFDGATLKISDKLDWADSCYLNTAGFVVNERINHFGFVAEAGLYNIKDTGIDLKYSFIHWRKNGRGQCFHPSKGVDEKPNYFPPGSSSWYKNPLGFRFLISQVTMYYNFNPDYFCGMPAALYGAFLYNHDQNRLNYVDKRTKQHKVAHNINTGWYVGFEIGEVKKEGDWSLDIEYQYVNPLAVPDGDSRGIGRGNILDESFTNVERGNTNFKGWKFDFFYGITDDLTINTVLEFTKAARPEIGGHHTYSKFEIETIYAF